MDPTPPGPQPPQDSPKATPGPYTLPQMLEDTFLAPLTPGAIFERLAQAPPPDYGMMVLNLLVFWVAMFGINILHVSIANPAAAARYDPVLKGVIAAVALAAVLLGSFVGAGVLHVCCLIAGGAGEFARSYQIVSTLSVLAPLQAFLNGFPVAWMLPTLLACYVAVVAAEHLHGTSPLRTRVIFPVLFAFCLASLWGTRLALERARDLAGMAQQFQQLRQFQQAAAGTAMTTPSGPGAQADPMAQAQVLTRQAQSLIQAQQAQQLRGGPPGQTKPASGLDMIATPYGATSDKNLGQAPVMSQQQIDSMRQATDSMINSIMPMINDPALTRNLPPEARKQLQDLTRMIAQMQANLKSGKPMTPEERQKLQETLQKVMMQSIPQAPQMPQQAPVQQTQP